MRRSLMLALIAGAAMQATPLGAHPHVFAEARLEVAVLEGNVSALRHLWRFDDVFTSTVLVEFDANGNLELDNDELETIGNVVRESIAEFDFFQTVTKNGAAVPMDAPEIVIADIQDQQLLILFESAPSDPLPLTGDLAFGVYDPTFYTAIEFTSDDHLTVDPAAPGCQAKVVRPDPDEAIAQNQDTLTEAFFNDPGGNDLSKLFATRLELKCPAALVQ